MLAEPATTVGRKGRRVNRLQHKVARLVYHVGLAAGIAAPKHIYQMLTLLGQSTNGSIGELLPAEGGVAVGLMGTDSEGGIEQEYTLASPARQVA